LRKKEEILEKYILEIKILREFIYLSFIFSRSKLQKNVEFFYFLFTSLSIEQRKSGINIFSNLQLNKQNFFFNGNCSLHNDFFKFDYESLLILPCHKKEEPTTCDSNILRLKN